MKKSILEANKSYTFSDYFKLPYPTRDIVAEFDYHFELKKLELPQKEIKDIDLNKLQDIFYKKLPHISVNSEAAKREFFIAPLLLEILDYLEIEIDLEYPLNINEKLRGNIDYIIRSKTKLMIIEAKNADLDRGFNQLAVEMIAMALDNNDENNNNLLYGAITTGDIWRFGILDHKNKIVYKDIDAFLIPKNIKQLFAVFLGILM